MSLHVLPPNDRRACHCVDDGEARDVQAATRDAREYASSEPVVRTFCERCGCSLSYAHHKYPDEIDLTIASLDDPSGIVPTAHIWMGDAASWDRPGDGLPQHAGWRSAP